MELSDGTFCVVAASEAEAARLFARAPLELEAKLEDGWAPPPNGEYRVDEGTYHRYSFWSALSLAPGDQRRPGGAVGVARY